MPTCKKTHVLILLVVLLSVSSAAAAQGIDETIGCDIENYKEGYNAHISSMQIPSVLANLFSGDIRFDIEGEVFALKLDKLKIVNALPKTSSPIFEVKMSREFFNKLLIADDTLKLLNYGILTGELEITPLGAPNVLKLEAAKIWIKRDFGVSIQTNYLVVYSNKGLIEKYGTQNASALIDYLNLYSAEKRKNLERTLFIIPSLLLITSSVYYLKLRKREKK